MLKMNVKLFLVLFLFFLVNGVVPAKVSKKTATVGNKDEEIYGDLGDTDLQKDQDYYTDEVEAAPEEETGESENKIDVHLVSKPETFSASTGDVVKLPCRTSTSKDDLVRIWVKDGSLVFQGAIAINPQMQNLKYLNDGSLEVKLESVEDFGQYSCKVIVETNDQPEVVHSIVQITSPKIVELYANDNKTTDFNPGDILTLTCQATGYPKAKISWHKNNERLGTEGETLTIQNVKVKHAGSYRCLADNGINPPAHKHIEIHVNHAPVVSIDKYIVNSDHKKDAELICEVKAYPTPGVNWQKNGENLVSNEPKIKFSRERNNERNILIIKDIDESDFGEYTCVAINALGRQSKNVSLVKTPVIRKVANPESSNTKDVILQWKVESKQPISMHEIQYRKKGETTWKSLSPDVADGENDVYQIQQTLQGLEPGEYETRARSKNTHGWSNYSEVTHFGTKHSNHHLKAKHAKKGQKEQTQDASHDIPAQHRTEEKSQIGESTSNGSMKNYSLYLVVLTLLTTRYFNIRG